MLVLCIKSSRYLVWYAYIRLCFKMLIIEKKMRYCSTRSYSYYRMCGMSLRVSRTRTTRRAPTYFLNRFYSAILSARVMSQKTSKSQLPSDRCPRRGQGGFLRELISIRTMYRMCWLRENTKSGDLFPEKSILLFDMSG